MEIYVKITYVLNHRFYHILWFYPYQSFKHSNWWHHRL